MLLHPSDQQKIRQSLDALPSAVRLLFFTQSLGCEGCAAAGEIVAELAKLSEKLSLEEVNFVLDKEQVAAYGVDRVPAIAILGKEDYGIRFFGVPAGYEFTSLLDAVMLAGRGESGLSADSRALLAAVTEPTSLQVFSTPT
ncbi:MAG: thioredoxin family protein [Acidobacteria bacterium]|nr:thioredoxin family protein [Acidobacteriota bacterium]MBI3265129.1 thioredoxin family protein [Acidobacteriota bacterium]